MSEPTDWFGLVCLWCQIEGLQTEDAEDCVWETFERYHRKRGCYPWEEQEPDLALLRQKAKDVSKDFIRKLVRRERLLAQAVVFLPRASIPSPEETIVDRLDTQAFTAQLPEHLRRFVELRLSGYTLQEVAQQMNITVGTAKRYGHNVKQRLIEFYGLDATFSPLDDGINSGSSQKWGLPNSQMEVTDDETMDRLASDADTDNLCDGGNDRSADPDPDAGGGRTLGLGANVATLEERLGVAAGIAHRWRIASDALIALARRHTAVHQ